jgi:alpha-tubulin suppressor-like RCC1 family protein
MMREALSGALIVMGLGALAGCGSETAEPLPGKFEQVEAGVLHSCGIVSGGFVYCWGNNDYGQLGDGSRRTRLYPHSVVGTIRYGTVSPGAGHTCGIATNGVGYCWGLNANGQLGDGTRSDRATPGLIQGSLSWLVLVAGGAYTCGIATDSLAYCWGWNGTGQLGDGTTIDRLTPVAVSGGHKFRWISVNSFHTCGLATDGTTYCWGANDYGQLGTGNTTPSATPVAVQGGRSFVSIEVGFYHSCGLAADGTGYCWGRNHFGQLGLGESGAGADQPLPVAIAGNRVWAGLSPGAFFSCGLEAGTGDAYCWGINASGQLGTDVSDRCTDPSGGVYQCTFSPALVKGGIKFASVSASTQHACGLSREGVAYCWGLGSDGQLGNGQQGTQVFSIQPVKVGGQP